jgi:hypothetical protein
VGEEGGLNRHDLGPRDRKFAIRKAASSGYPWALYSARAGMLRVLSLPFRFIGLPPVRPVVGCILGPCWDDASAQPGFSVLESSFR